MTTRPASHLAVDERAPPLSANTMEEYRRIQLAMGRLEALMRADVTYFRGEVDRARAALAAEQRRVAELEAEVRGLRAQIDAQREPTP